MSRLKSYSCSKCGGILNVDRDQDVLDCPFCGTRFDYVRFHSEELLAKAEQDLKCKDFDSAKEKYKTVLSKEPDNFIALRGYALCAGEISSADKLDDPVNLNKCFYNGILRVLAEEEYRMGPYAEYFTKLSEAIIHAQEYNRSNREKKSLCNIHGLDDRVDKAGIRLKSAEENYHSAIEELKNLEPDTDGAAGKNAVVFTGGNASLDDHQQIVCAKCAGKLVLDKSRKLYLCSHCGVAYGYSLFYGDPLQKAMEILKQGDYEEADQRFIHILMIDKNNMDANIGRILCAGKWKSFADIRLSDELTGTDWDHLLEHVDELCDSISDQTRSYYLSIKDLMKFLKKYSDNLIMIRCEPNNKTYRDKKAALGRLYYPRIRQLMNYDRLYHQASSDVVDNPATAERMAAAKEALKRGDFAAAEEAYKVLIVETQNEPPVVRDWILCAGKWSAFRKMKVSDYRNERQFDILIQRVEEARQLLPDEYNCYFDMLSELLSKILEYHENELIIKQCKDAEDKLSKDIRDGEVDVNDDRITYMWMEMTSKTGKYKNIGMNLKKEYGDMLYGFLKKDRELFGE